MSMGVRLIPGRGHGLIAMRPRGVNNAGLIVIVILSARWDSEMRICQEQGLMAVHIGRGLFTEVEDYSQRLKV